MVEGREIGNREVQPRLKCSACGEIREVFNTRLSTS